MTFITGEKHQESREWGVIIPFFAVRASEGIICPKFIANEGTSGTTWNAVSLLPGRQTTQTSTQAHKHMRRIYVQRHLHVEMLARTHKNMHAGAGT